MTGTDGRPPQTPAGPPPTTTQVPDHVLDWIAAGASPSAARVVLTLCQAAFRWGWSSPLSMDELMQRSGLSRQGATDGAQEAMNDGLAQRHRAGPKYVYALRLAVSNSDNRSVNQASSAAVPSTPEVGVDVEPKPTSKATSTATSKSTPRSKANGVDSLEVRVVWDHYRAVHASCVRGSNLPIEPPEDERKLIRDALRAVGDAGSAKLNRAIDGLFGSDFHQKRGEYAERTGRRHTSLSDCLRAKRPGPHSGTGRTTLETIEFFCAKRDEQEQAARRAEHTAERDWEAEAMERQGITEEEFGGGG